MVPNHQNIFKSRHLQASRQAREVDTPQSPTVPRMKLLGKFGQALYSAYVWTVAFAVMGLGAFITLPLLVLRFPYQKVHGWVTAPMFSATLPVATIRLRVHYHPDFDPEVRSVFGQNHINLLDGMLAAKVIPHAFSGLMNAWQFKIPIYGWLMSLSKGIPVDKTKRETLIEDISAAARNRKEIGMSVLTFPEGHRTMTGNVGQFRTGVFRMAVNAGMPVVPIAVRGLYDVNNKNMGWFFRAFQTVDVFVGPQFDTAPYEGESVSKLAKRVRAYLVSCLEHGEFPASMDVVPPDAEAPVQQPA